MLTTGVIEIRTERSGCAERFTLQPELVDDLPDVPVLPGTLLLMELKAHEISVDLHEMSQLVLSDPGATLQILRLAAHEYGNGGEHPSRIEDCISSLGLQACLKAAARQTVTGHPRHRAVLEIWAHSLEVAKFSSALDEASSGTSGPEAAYLVGLLHALPLMPAVLGWNCRERGLKDEAAEGLSLAERWRLPRCVQDFFREASLPGQGTQWTGIVERAHQMARRSSVQCPLYHRLTPRLHKRA